MAKKLTQEEFITRSTVAHNEVYDYSKVNYVNSTTKVIILCPIHGEFAQIPKTHMNGHGCHQCKKDQQCLTLEDFRQAATDLHKNFYSYENVIFRTSKDIVNITCPIHGIFKQSVNHHLTGRGCNACWKHRYSTKLFLAKPTILYYLKLTSTTTPLYKIGITSKSIETRYHGEGVTFEILHSETFTNGYHAYRKEQLLLAMFAEARYTGNSPFKYTGTSELFILDILEKDTNE